MHVTMAAWPDSHAFPGWVWRGTPFRLDQAVSSAGSRALQHMAVKSEMKKKSGPAWIIKFRPLNESIAGAALQAMAGGVAIPESDGQSVATVEPRLPLFEVYCKRPWLRISRSLPRGCPAWPPITVRSTGTKLPQIPPQSRKVSRAVWNCIVRRQGRDRVDQTKHPCASGARSRSTYRTMPPNIIPCRGYWHPGLLT
jgi:hypothetical protein